MRSKKRSEVGLMSKQVISRRSQKPKKKVSRKALMPPPTPDVSDTWRPGDVFEVFEKGYWKMAVLSQILGNKFFQVRPIGSSSQFKVTKANIRERVSWTYDPGDALEKDLRNWTDGEDYESSNVKYDDGSNDADNFACSVGSCTIASNDNDDDFSNAESVLHKKDEKQKENMNIHAKEELEAEIHKLELHAYRCTIEALHALGPLSWEREELMTNLRISLHITNDEYLVELRSLISGNTSR